MELYITLSYFIKYSNIGLFCYVIREITVIFQASTAKKSKYVIAITKKLYISNTKIFDPQI